MLHFPKQLCVETQITQKNEQILFFDVFCIVNCISCAQNPWCHVVLTNVAIAADPILRSHSRPFGNAALCHVKQAGPAPVLVTCWCLPLQIQMRHLEMVTKFDQSHIYKIL